MVSDPSTLSPDTPPFAHVLTSASPGAVAVIRVQASSATAQRAFQNFQHNGGQLPHLSSTGRLLYGVWGTEDLIVVRTSSTQWEILCHGGNAAQSRILHDLAESGVPAGTPEPPFSHQSDARIVHDCIEANLQQCRTRAAANWVIAQTDGRLLALRKQLNSADSANRQHAVQQVRQWRSFAAHLTEAFQVTLIGAPNAGKSSLINALTGRDRAIVSHTPGTTRDMIAAETVLDGWLVSIRDCAGIRGDATTLPEQLGIVQSLRAAESSDLICLVTDHPSATVPVQMAEIRHICRCPVLQVHNKCDLWLDREEMTSPDCSAEQPVSVSALTGFGLSRMKARMISLLTPQHPPRDAALPLPGSWEDLLQKSQL